MVGAQLELWRQGSLATLGFWPHSSTLVGRSGVGGGRDWLENNGRGGHVVAANNGEVGHMIRTWINEDLPALRRRQTTNDVLLVYCIGIAQVSFLFTKFRIYKKRRKKKGKLE